MVGLLINYRVVMGVLRHVLTAVGTLLVTYGWLEADLLEKIVGASMTLIGLIWSAWDKSGRAT